MRSLAAVLLIAGLTACSASGQGATTVTVTETTTETVTVAEATAPAESAFDASTPEPIFTACVLGPSLDFNVEVIIQAPETAVQQAADSCDEIGLVFIDSGIPGIWVARPTYDDRLSERCQWVTKPGDRRVSSGLVVRVFDDGSGTTGRLLCLKFGGA